LETAFTLVRGTHERESLDAAEVFEAVEHRPVGAGVGVVIGVLLRPPGVTLIMAARSHRGAGAPWRRRADARNRTCQ